MDVAADHPVATVFEPRAAGFKSLDGITDRGQDAAFAQPPYSRPVMAVQWDLRA